MYHVIKFFISHYTSWTDMDVNHNLTGAQKDTAAADTSKASQPYKDRDLITNVSKTRMEKCELIHF